MSIMRQRLQRRWHAQNTLPSVRHSTVRDAGVMIGIQLPACSALESHFNPCRLKAGAEHGGHQHAAHSAALAAVALPVGAVPCLVTAKGLTCLQGMLQLPTSNG
jgi:hypothetical protein